MDVLAYEEVDEDDSAKAYMTVGNPGNCVGCQACGRTCPKKCFSFEPVVA
jgi:NAD-dependent dihydropyrimidine dehydrogenase PreA subunit